MLTASRRSRHRPFSPIRSLQRQPPGGVVDWAMQGTAQAQDDATENVRIEGLLSLSFLEVLAPVSGSELEDAVTGPARE
jgi:hypothetical protein